MGAVRQDICVDLPNGLQLARLTDPAQYRLEYGLESSLKSLLETLMATLIVPSLAPPLSESLVSQWF